MNKKTWLIILVIICIASIVRLFALGNVPHGLSWDEAAVGYNGWSVWTIHRDEWLQLLPISFKSFGDFKAPVAIYLNGISTTIFGRNAWAIRLPYAVIGIVSIVVFFLIGSLLVKQKWWTESSVLYGALLFAIIPWHIHFSRIAFESGIALLFLLLGSLFLILGFVEKRAQVSTTFISILLFSLAMYTYHSAKLFVPVFLILLCLIFWRWIVAHWKKCALYLVVLIACITPLVIDSVVGQGATRSEVLLPFSRDSIPAYFIAVSENIGLHLDPSYLLFGKIDTARHGDGMFGILLPGMTLIMLIGVLTPIFRLRHASQPDAKAKRNAYLIAFAWYIAGMISGWISKDAPHANRTLIALPAYLMFAMIGWNYAAGYVSSRASFRALLVKIILGLTVIIDLLCFSAYQYHYYGRYSQQSEGEFQAGYSELFTYLDDLKSENSLPSTIVLSSKYGQPYIYALLYQNIDAISYHHGALYRFMFVDTVSMADLQRTDALIISTIFDKLESPETDIIRSESGQSRFYVYKTNN